MPWDPQIYHQFKSIRQQPFFDLLNLIADGGIENGIDLGCGTGEQTCMLSERFEEAQFLGIDSSAEMLEKAITLKCDRLHFENATTEEVVATGRKWDLIFSNAALQWSDNHRKLFPELIALVTENGQFAVQMPMQRDNVLNKILLELVQEEPFSAFLNGWKRDVSMLDIDSYAQIMFDGGLQDIQIIQKVYPIIAPDYQTMIDFISGSAMIPYFERLTEEQKDLLMIAYEKRISQYFSKLPAIYSFKRLLLYGRRVSR